MGKSCYEKSEENIKYPTRNEIVINPKLEIDRIFNILFSNQNKKITKEELHNFLEYMKDYNNQLYFLNKINQVRTTSYEIPEEVFQYLKKIFSFILDLFNIHNISNEEIGIVSYIIILSQTYYYFNKGIIKSKKIYLSEKLKSKNVFKNDEFWEKFLEYLINEEINKQKKVENIDFTEEQIQKLKAKLAFGQMLSVILKMKNFGFKKRKIRNIIHDSSEKYNISEEHKDTVNSYIDNK